jgi:hypothetical protein
MSRRWMEVSLASLRNNGLSVCLQHTHLLGLTWLVEKPQQKKNSPTSPFHLPKLQQVGGGLIVATLVL